MVQRVDRWSVGQWFDGLVCQEKSVLVNGLSMMGRWVGRLVGGSTGQLRQKVSQKLMGQWIDWPFSGSVSGTINWSFCLFLLFFHSIAVHSSIYSSCAGCSATL